MTTLRQFYRQFLWQRHLKVIRVIDPSSCGRRSVVFSPHPDDETLGCGGLIIKKRQAGARVQVIFMTDGSQSHASAMSPREAAALRRGEALAATRELGLGSEDVCFLEFPDRELAANSEGAVERVRSVLRQFQPDEIYTSSRFDTTPDHLATNRIVHSAVQAEGGAFDVYEYPVWFWHHWPWVPFVVARPLRKSIKPVRDSLGFGLGLGSLRSFNCALPIRDVRDRKQAALDRYESQITRLVPGKQWPTLGDVGKGEFLNCFFGDWELFSMVKTGPAPQGRKR